MKTSSLASPRRRALVLGAASAASLAGCASTGRTSSIGASDVDDYALLNRITWGVDSASWSLARRRTSADYVQDQLHPAAGLALPAEVAARVAALPLLSQPMSAWVTELDRRRRDADATADDDAKKAAQQAYQQQLNALASDAGTRALYLALYSGAQLREQATWFWFNHFNVHRYKANLRVMVGDYEDRLRTHALGRFRDLLIASATHAAMIRYLDNEQNAANRINENYAREVMELHTLGVQGGYSQRDVQELARVLTGLGVNFSDRTPTLKPALQALYVRDGATEFNPARHDMGVKQVLGVQVAGQGWPEIIGQLTRLAKHPATAQHVSRKLAVYFMADEPAAAVVARMSDVFLASDGDIAATLQAMFASGEFKASLGRKFKDPVHYVVSAVRLAYDGKTILNCAPMRNWLARLGQDLYNRQTPDGYPMDETAWASSGQMTTRFEIARTIGAGSAGLFRADGAASDAAAFPQLSNALFHQVIAMRLTPSTRAALDAAASAQEWNALLLSSPEFMYR